MDISIPQLLDYIQDAVIKNAPKGKPFEWNGMIEQIIGQPPYDAFRKQMTLSKIVVDHHDNKFPDALWWLIHNDYIQYVTNTKGEYILSAKGLQAQKVGSIKKYMLKEKWDKFWSIYLKWAAIILPPATVASLVFAILSYNKKPPPVYKKIETYIDSLTSSQNRNHNGVNADSNGRSVDNR